MKLRLIKLVVKRMLIDVTELSLGELYSALRKTPASVRVLGISKQGESVFLELA